MDVFLLVSFHFCWSLFTTYIDLFLLVSFRNIYRCLFTCVFVMRFMVNLVQVSFCRSLFAGLFLQVSFCKFVFAHIQVWIQICRSISVCVIATWWVCCFCFLLLLFCSFLFCLKVALNLLVGHYLKGKFEESNVLDIICIHIHVHVCTHGCTLMFIIYNYLYIYIHQHAFSIYIRTI